MCVRQREKESAHKSCRSRGGESDVRSRKVTIHPYRSRDGVNYRACGQSAPFCQRSATNERTSYRCNVAGTQIARLKGIARDDEEGMKMERERGEGRVKEPSQETSETMSFLRAI